MSTKTLRTPAWQMVGITVSVPGVLELADGRLGFTTVEGRVFEAPLAEVSDVVFPWYYFGGGVKLRVGGEQVRISFVRPNDATDVPGRVLAGEGDAGAALLTVGRKVDDIGQGRAAGSAWRAILEAGADKSA
jgi:hypothetical protein